MSEDQLQKQLRTVTDEKEIKRIKRCAAQRSMPYHAANQFRVADSELRVMYSV